MLLSPPSLWPYCVLAFCVDIIRSVVFYFFFHPTVCFYYWHSSSRVQVKRNVLNSWLHLPRCIQVHAWGHTRCICVFGSFCVCVCVCPASSAAELLSHLLDEGLIRLSVHLNFHQQKYMSCKIKCEKVPFTRSVCSSLSLSLFLNSELEVDLVLSFVFIRVSVLGMVSTFLLLLVVLCH